MSKRFPPEELLRFQAAGSKQSPFYTGVLEALPTSARVATRS